MKMKKKVTILIIKTSSEKKKADAPIEVTGTRSEPSHTMNMPEPKTALTRYSKDRTNGVIAKSTPMRRDIKRRANNVNRNNSRTGEFQK